MSITIPNIKMKNCSSCGTPFQCGDSAEGNKCWCNELPPVFVPSEVVDCLCSSCFTTACSIKIDEFVAEITPETALGNKASLLPETTNIVEGIDYYFEDGNYVFKPWFHLKRGYCCKSDCTHCPY
jgi:hypothetical protein